MRPSRSRSNFVKTLIHPFTPVPDDSRVTNRSVRQAAAAAARVQIFLATWRKSALFGADAFGARARTTASPIDARQRVHAFAYRTTACHSRRVRRFPRGTPASRQSPNRNLLFRRARPSPARKLSTNRVLTVSLPPLFAPPRSSNFTQTSHSRRFLILPRPRDGAEQAKRPPLSEHR